MTRDKEPMIVCPHEKGGYAVRPMSWGGIWTEDGKLKSTCRFTALFTEKADADEYCRICNDISTFSILSLRGELLKHGAIWDAFVASIASALKDDVLPFGPEDELAEKILRRVVGDESARSFGGSFSCEFKTTDALQKLFDDAKKEMSTVDITGYSPKIILQILADFNDDIETLVTTDIEHYEMLKGLSGFTCVPYDNDLLYGKSLVLDKAKTLKAARIEFWKRGDE